MKESSIRIKLFLPTKNVIPIIDTGIKELEKAYKIKENISLKDLPTRFKLILTFTK
tara:strand:+ start:2255 stop:2422 length:168 start_codon:yes stop_codon:yes gene_type:complete